MRRINIYITNLGRYNEGMLIGEWVKLPVDQNELQNVLNRIGINEQYEEYFITDYETLFSNLHINEYASISDLNTLAERIDSLANSDYDKLAAVLECEGNTSISEIIELIDELVNFVEGVEYRRGTADAAATGRHDSGFGTIVDPLHQPSTQHRERLGNILHLTGQRLFDVVSVSTLREMLTGALEENGAHRIISFEFIENLHHLHQQLLTEGILGWIGQRNDANAAHHFGT